MYLWSFFGFLGMRMQVKVKMNKTITILILLSTFLLTTIIFLSLSLWSPSLVKSGVVSNSSVTTFKTGTEPETIEVPTTKNTTNTKIPKYQEAKRAEEAQKENNTTKQHFDENKKGPSAVHENKKLQKEKVPAGISSQDLNAAKERLRRPRANSDHLSDKDKVVLPKGTDESFLRARMLERRERTKKDEKEAVSDGEEDDEEDDDFDFLMSTPKNEENKHENTKNFKSPASVTASNKRPPSPQSSPKSTVGLSKKSSDAPTSLLEQIKSKRENLKSVNNHTNTNPTLTPNPNTTPQASTKAGEVVNVKDDRGAQPNANVGMFKGESIEKMIKQSKSYKNPSIQTTTTDSADNDDEW